MNHHLSKLLYIQRIIVLVTQILLCLGSITCVVLGIVFTFTTGNWMSLIAYILIAIGGISLAYLLNFLRKLIRKAELETKDIIDRLDILEGKTPIKEDVED